MYILLAVLLLASNLFWEYEPKAVNIEVYSESIYMTWEQVNPRATEVIISVEDNEAGHIIIGHTYTTVGKNYIWINSKEIVGGTLGAEDAYFIQERTSSRAVTIPNIVYGPYTGREMKNTVFLPLVRG